MPIKVNPELMKEIKKYGAFDISACFNCGNCTAVCPLSKDKSSFPRKIIRYGQLGIDGKIESSLEPWHCYYCGECSDTCPRQAEPGEYMMAIRRYLIAKYDFTGLSGIFYKNGYLQLFLAAAGISGLFFYFRGYSGDFSSLAGKIEMAFPVYVSVAIAGYLWNMYKSVIIKKLGKFRLSFRVRDIREMLYHGLTQINFVGCDKKDWARWIAHLLVMSGYTLTLLISNLHLFRPLEERYGFFSPVSLLVWYASFSIVAGGIFMMGRRLLGKVPSSRFSHPSDWLFAGMLFLIGFSMFASLYANVKGSSMLAGIYKAHISVEIVWILLVVPFTKWIHIFFRPLAVYYERVLDEK